jgi:hypothetical protein
MFYPKLLEVNELEFLGDLINAIDKWFAFLTNSERESITASKLASKFGIDYTIADSLLMKITDLGILEEVFIIECPECELPLVSSTKNKLVDDINSLNHCYRCNKDIVLTFDNVIVAYKLIEMPSASESELREYTQKLLGLENKISFRDRLDEHIKNGGKDINDFFTCPPKMNMRK